MGLFTRKMKEEIDERANMEKNSAGEERELFGYLLQELQGRAASDPEDEEEYADAADGVPGPPEIDSIPTEVVRNHVQLDEQIARAKNKGNEPLAPPTEMENQWAAQRMAEELRQLQHQTPEELPQSPQSRKRRKSLGRTHQIMTRLTDSELVQFRRRVKTSGVPQGDFLRSMALTGQIVVEEHGTIDVAVLDELAMIRAELGRQGGLLKMLIKPNEARRELDPEEWADLIRTIRDMDTLRRKMSDLEVTIYGHHKASNQ